MKDDDDDDCDNGDDDDVDDDDDGGGDDDGGAGDGDDDDEMTLTAPGHCHKATYSCSTPQMFGHTFLISERNWKCTTLNTPPCKMPGERSSEDRSSGERNSGTGPSSLIRCPWGPWLQSPPGPGDTAAEFPGEEAPRNEAVCV